MQTFTKHPSRSQLSTSASVLLSDDTRCLLIDNEYVVSFRFFARHRKGKKLLQANSDSSGLSGDSSLQTMQQPEFESQASGRLSRCLTDKTSFSQFPVD